jgi:hypothetical protein
MEIYRGKIVIFFNEVGRGQADQECLNEPLENHFQTTSDSQ